MKTRSGLFSCSRGFTLAELLTAMAIMAILIGLLVPTITIIRKTAQKVRQKSQFHGIDIALESFRTDFGDYPNSSYDTGVDPGYCGAQKLAEAIVGWDGFGVHPKTEWRSDGLADWNGDSVYDDPDESVYHVTFDTPYESREDNRKVRYGPYLELEAANAVKIGDLYPNPVGTPPSFLDPRRYVLADMFGKVTHLTTRKRTGMPILYYKADVGSTEHRPTNVFVAGLPWPPQNIYNVTDNGPIYITAPPFGNRLHELAADQATFYDRTTNPNFPGRTIPPNLGLGRRPYRSESFILHSAGRDGLYGTADDVYNFDTE